MATTLLARLDELADRRFAATKGQLIFVGTLLLFGCIGIL